MKLIPQQTIIVDDQGYCVATMERGGYAQRLADAQTIAHRVNVHDELVAALERLLDAFLEARDMAIKRNPLDGDELVLSLQCAGGAEGAAREALARVKP